MQGMLLCVGDVVCMKVREEAFGAEGNAELARCSAGAGWRQTPNGEDSPGPVLL